MRYTEYETISNIHTDIITKIAFGADGKLLASAGLDGNIYIWDVERMSLRYHYFTGHAILSIVWADCERILCGLKDGSITCLVINSEMNSLDITGTWGHSYPVEVLAVAKNRLASGAHQELFIWRWNYNAVMSYQEREIALSRSSRIGSDDEMEILVTALHWSGRNGGGLPALLIVGYMHHGIRIFETQRWGEVQHIPVEGLVGSASVSPDNKYIAVSDVVTGFHIYRLNDGKSFMHFEQEVHEARPVPVTWVHGGNAILGGSTIPKVMIWYVHTGSKRISLPVPGNSKVLAITAYNNSDSNSQVFFVACGTETRDHEFSVVVWRAEEPRDHESVMDSDDESSSSSPEPEPAGAPNHYFAAWLLLSALMVAGIAVAHQLAGNDLFDFHRS